MPTEADLRYFSSLLSPPKGYGQLQQKTIRRCFGLADKQSAISWKTVGLTDVGNDALNLVMSYVLQPQFVETLCSTSRCFEDAAKNPASWRNVRIDTAGFKPCGLAAHSHWRLWQYAALVVAAHWNHANVALLMHKRIKCWRWAGGAQFRVFRGRFVLASQFPIRPRGGANLLVAGRAKAPLLLCIANTRDAYEILECLDGEPREGRLCLAALFADNSEVGCFSRNGKVLGGTALALSSLQGYVSMSLFIGLLKLTIDGECKASVVIGHTLPEDDYFCTIVGMGDASPEITAIPCWSMD